MLSIINIFRWNECSSLFCMRHCSRKQWLYLIKTGPLSFYYSTLCRITHVFTVDRWNGNALWWCVHFSVAIQTILADTLNQFNPKNCIPVWKSNGLTGLNDFLFWTKTSFTDFQLVAYFGTFLLCLWSSIVGQPNSSDWLLGREFSTRDWIECNSELLRQQ